MLTNFAGVNIAGVRFRNVLKASGGPVDRVESGRFHVRGQPWYQANAYLNPGLVPEREGGLYAPAHGTGASRDSLKAGHMAISEAMERWAYHSTVNGDQAAAYGFDIDPSSNGMAAFPGLLARQARRRAYLEAVERFSIMTWWDGLVDGHVISTDWPGVDAVLINGPAGGVTAITFTKNPDGYAIGHAADESIGAACEKAIVEMERHAKVVRYWRAANDESRVPASVLERRSLYFATEEGFSLFKSRIGQKQKGAQPAFEIVCDSEIPGPWGQYSTVWRVAFRPTNNQFIGTDTKYFFC
jgi:hypothetical protein